jgi:hypothetical protein
MAHCLVIETGDTDMAFATISAQSITFFPSFASAVKMAEANGGEANGFVVAPAVGRDGKFVVKVLDTDDGFMLGHL